MNEEPNIINLSDEELEKQQETAEQPIDDSGNSTDANTDVPAEEELTDNDSESKKDDNESQLEELKKVIEDNAREDERPSSRNLTFSKILGGDILTTKAVRSQVWLILLIAFFTMVYVSNRYNCQKKLIEIDKLENELQNAKYKALSISSELTELSRESNVLEKLKANNDTTLKISSQPPYIVNTEE